MDKIVITGILLPFAGTALGAACVFFMKKGVGKKLQDALAGSAAGVMVAAAVWSLMLPALESAPEGSGKLAAFIPAGAGFIAGTGSLLLLDFMIPRIENRALRGKIGDGREKSTKLMILAVTLHNFPEGLAVGVALAGYLDGNLGVSSASVAALAFGIAVQNFPEGAIVSLPLRGAGRSKSRSFLAGAASGAVEPLGAVITLAAAHFITPAMPFLLCYAAGAMIYVVVEELVPQFARGDGAHPGTAAFAAGFTLMMALDVMLG